MSAQLIQDALGLLSGSLVGFSLGLVGGGGSILAVPLMIYLVDVPSAHVASVRVLSPSQRTQRLISSLMRGWGR